MNINEMHICFTYSERHSGVQLYGQLAGVCSIRKPGTEPHRRCDGTHGFVWVASECGERATWSHAGQPSIWYLFWIQSSLRHACRSWSASRATFQAVQCQWCSARGKPLSGLCHLGLLHTQWLGQIWLCVGWAEVDLFATAENTCYPLW